MGFQDLMVWGFSVLAIALVVLIGATMWTTILNVPLGDYSVNQTYGSGNTTINPSVLGTSIFGALDWVFMLFAIGLVITMLISGLLIPSHPIFLFIALFGLVIWVLIAPFLSNAYIFMVNETVLGDASDAYPFINTVMYNLPLIGLVIGGLLGVFMYGKNMPKTGFGST